MATARTKPEPITGDAELDEEIAKFEKRGNWVEDRKEILKNLTGAEIDAIAERIEAEHPEEYSSQEEIMAMAKEGMEEAQPTGRRVELVGA